MAGRRWGAPGDQTDHAAQEVLPRRLCLAVAWIALLLSIGTATAFADTESPDYLSGTSFEELEKGLDPSIPNVLDEPITELGNAEELPHQDLGRSEALELMQSVFGPLIDNTAGLFDELDGAKLLSPNVVVIDGESGSEEASSSPMLIESALPLSVDGSVSKDAIVDLDLEHGQQELQPSNPLVEIDIPSDLGEGISFPDRQITIDVLGAPSERSPSTVAGSSAFYPNVAEDSDLVVAPTATGMETFTQLRSADSPHTLRFQLTMPAGASLLTTEVGGAIVQRGEETLMLVHAPVAIDATGSDVPVSLSVAGDNIVLAVAAPADAAYPILVDPLYETFDWEKYYGKDGNSYFLSMPGWKSESDSPAFSTRNWTVGEYAGHWGAAIGSGGYNLTPETRAGWRYYIPKYFSDYEKYGVRPTTYIDKVTLKQLEFRFATAYPSSQYSPYFIGGIYDGMNKNFVSIAMRSGQEGQLTNPFYEYQFQNPNQNVNAKDFGIYLASNQSGPNPERQVWASYVSIALSDKDKPAFGSLSAPSQWMNDKAIGAIPFSVSDLGLGVSKITVSNPRPGNAPLISEAEKNCVGGVEKPCPRTWANTDSGSPQLAYYPQVMPQGENWVAINAHDPAGRTSADGGAAPQVRIKVDHTAPSVKLSGPLTEQEEVGLQETYALQYSAADGFDATPSAAAPFGPGTSGSKPYRPRGVVADQEGHVWVVDRENARVLKFDEGGKYLSQFGSYGTGNGQFQDPRGIALAPNGTLWVADAVRGRIQQFSSNGQFLQGFGTKVSSPSNDPTAFFEPYGVAAAPNGRIWVSDSGNNRVALFNESAVGQPRFELNAFGSPSNGTGKSELSTPVGIATDANGNVWVAEYGAHRVAVFDSSGQFLMRFGSEGSGDGQFKFPIGIAIAPAGHVFVTDEKNHRVQEFMASGAYLRQFGSTGTANNQLQEPKGIALGVGNVAFVADSGNSRVARWTGADFDPQSGVVKTEVKVDGNLVEPAHAPGCATKNCAISREWTLDADDYAPGQHNVEVTATDGVGLTKTETLEVETHGDLTPPSIALSGSMTQQASIGTTWPSYTLKVSASDPGSAEERKSGVASTIVKVDGKVVDATAPGCPVGGCSITREWTLQSDSYAVGQHEVIVSATDAAGHTATKTLTIQIERDTTVPVLNATNAFYTAPSGWLEQKSYNVNATATDTNGYGVTSLVLKIDGEAVKSKTQTCPSGGCLAMLGFVATIDMTTYDGGAHPAELIATDGAGNWKKRSWTINVDPKGEVSTVEATRTLEAVTDTAGDGVPNLFEGSSEDEPELVSSDGELLAVNTNVPMYVDEEGGGAFTVEPASQEVIEGVEDGTAVVADPDSLSILPANPSPNAEDAEANNGAAIIANTTSSTDSVIRPIFDGALSFQSIREPASPTKYSWVVVLGSDQYLQQIDSQHAQVFYEGGYLAFTISAIPAHDAIGSPVPTSLSVEEGNVVTFNVQHQIPGIVYPVVAGAGWEGGFATHAVEMPAPEPLPEERTEPVAIIANTSPPEPVSYEEAGIDEFPAGERNVLWDARISGGPRRRHMVAVQCRVSAAVESGKWSCGNPWKQEPPYGDWNSGIRSTYVINHGVAVWHKGDSKNGLNCAKSAFGGINSSLQVNQVECDWRFKRSTSDRNYIASRGDWHVFWLPPVKKDEGYWPLLSQMFVNGNRRTLGKEDF